MGYTFTFIVGTPKGRQKIRRNARRMIHGLPAHKKKDREEAKEQGRNE